MPSRSINALERGELQRGLQLVTKDVEKLTREISGANSEPVKQAALVLRKEWRRLLSTPGGGEPSAPGSPPARQSGQLMRSIGTRIVQGVRRVGTGDFRSWMTEFGVGNAPPRPHARPALENSVEKMGEVLVTASQKAVEQAP